MIYAQQQNSCTHLHSQLNVYSIILLIIIIITWLYDIVLTGNTPAYIAAANGQVSSLSFLADHGADLNLANKDGNIYLFISSYNNYYKIDN